MLKLYENIKKRRMELNMSQQELAERVGYRGKSMISQVESGLIDLPQSMILKFAAALNCSASDLMGWNEDSSNIVIEFEESNPQDDTRQNRTVERKTPILRGFQASKFVVDFTRFVGCSTKSMKRSMKRMK